MLSGSESNSVIVRSCLVCPFLRGLGRHDARPERQHPRRNRYAPLSKNSLHYGAREGDGQPTKASEDQGISDGDDGTGSEGIGVGRTALVRVSGGGWAVRRRGSRQRRRGRCAASRMAAARGGGGM